MLYEEYEIRKEVIKCFYNLLDDVNKNIESKRNTLTDEQGKYVLMGMIAIRNEIVIHIEKMEMGFYDEIKII